MENLEFENHTNNLQKIKDILENGISKLKLILFRHGPKKEATGEKDILANYFSTQVKEGLNALKLNSSDYIHISSSPADRAKKTEDITIEHFEDSKNVKTKPPNKRLGTFDDLSEHLKSELNTLIQYQEKLEKKFKIGTHEKDENNREIQDKLKNKIDSIILKNMFDGTLDNLKQELNIDETLNLTTEDFSQNLKKHISGYLKHLSLLKSKTKKPVSLNITHSYPIMSFLKNYLKFIDGEQIKSANDMKGEEFLNKVGGCINETESITLNYIQKDNKKLIKVSGNNFEGYIDYEK